MMRKVSRFSQIVMLPLLLIGCGTQTQTQSSQDNEYEGLRTQCNLIFEIYNNAYGGDREWYMEQGDFIDNLAAKELVFDDAAISAKIKEFLQSDIQDTGLMLTQIANYCDSKGIKP
jgi:hypothetical protein